MWQVLNRYVKGETDIGTAGYELYLPELRGTGAF